ncbi:hypothetical protein [Endozoicomonas euniceicola]|uniref:Uncharacterized protein n=1 Tax=Endozoicomonas euniceicola TaxID=1234143 RepID=A0ABY6GW05_9GAMM|nr:hypothetical protein [Endozoicomonas euniceicola]UYM16261.1 hypothetical protein NX720_26280 [Endozoicomonas euniceicola]
MTRAKKTDEELVMRTRAEDRKRTKKAFTLGYQAGTCTTSKKMLRMSPPQQMAFHQNRKKQKPNDEMTENVLDMFEDDI